LSLAFGAANTNRVNLTGGSTGPTAADNLAAGTILMWIKPVAISNVYRVWVAKPKDASTDGITFFQKSGDGTAFKLIAARATSNQTVESATGILTAGVWHFNGVSWDITNGNPKAFHGTQTATVTDVTTSPANGSGAKNDDSANDLMVGNQDATNSFSANATIAWWSLWNVTLSLSQIESQRLQPFVGSGCIAFHHFSGTGTQTDLSGTGFNGTVTGATNDTSSPYNPFLRKALLNQAVNRAATY
jgi:hypothetical protein